ncbi:MAG: methyltransferase domain-containing protein [Kiritimatiellae bacterium]|nr:methyltransferase domain-containing protein [Kiritimatiellia bacterium]MDD5522695.1 methyltransferase domain-containing protein [Kiritimatiellia bacterium]
MNVAGGTDKVREKIRRSLARLLPGSQQEQRIRKYLRNGRLPWSMGYTEYRARFIETALADDDLMQTFRRQQALPSGYGMRVDERCIEYPWIISRLSPEPGLYLDAGSAFNHLHVLNHPAIAKKKLYIVTLSPEGHSFWARGISYLYEDLRSLPMKDCYYDCVMSVSTMEHIGFDNSLFGTPSFPGSDGSDAFLPAVHELWRVLKPGGQFFVTVPFGKYQNFGTFQQFDDVLLNRLEHAVDGIDVEKGFYRYEKQGWQLSNANECCDCEYFSWSMLPKEKRCEVDQNALDGAAAARAVVCLRISKPL